jgi:hypothetical protein
VEISNGAIIKCNYEMCVKVVNKSKIKCKTPLTVTLNVCFKVFNSVLQIFSHFLKCLQQFHASHCSYYFHSFRSDAATTAILSASFDFIISSVLLPAMAMLLYLLIINIHFGSHSDVLFNISSIPTYIHINISYDFSKAAYALHL